MRGFNQDGGVDQKTAWGHSVGDLVWMVKTMSWILRISLRSKEPLGGHPTWKAGHSAEQMTLILIWVAKNAAAFLKSWKWERTRSNGGLDLEEVWPMVGINSQASTRRRPTLNKTRSKREQGDKNSSDGRKNATKWATWSWTSPDGLQMNDPTVIGGVEVSLVPLRLIGQWCVRLLSIESQLVHISVTKTREKHTDWPEPVE